MRYLSPLLMVLSSAFAQGVVQVETTITATAGIGPGALTCIATPGIAGSSSFRVVCKVGTDVIHSGDSIVPSVPATAVFVHVRHGDNSVTWQLTKGNPAPDGWSVAANGVSRAGIF